MANPEIGLLSVARTRYGLPFKTSFDPRPVRREPLKTIAIRLINQVIQTGGEMIIDIEIPEISGRFSYIVDSKRILKASSEEREENLLEEISTAMNLSDKITIAKNFITLMPRALPRANIFEKFIKNEITWN